MSRHQNAGQNDNLITANKSFENVAKFTWLGTRVTILNCIHEEIQSRLNSGNACYHTDQKIFVFPVVLYGCETWSLTVREEQRLKTFEYRVLRRIFGPKREEVVGGWKRMHSEEVHSLYDSSYIVWVIKSSRIRWTGYVARMGAMRMYKIFWLENLKGGDHLEDLSVDGG
jgi:hypothetical protein